MGTQFRLTKEESALMDECRRTSFWYRSVPLMAITTGIMTYRRLTSPIIPKFYGLKLTGVIFGAYLVGKISYVPECRNLIRQRLPDSNLARSLDSKPYDLISDMAEPPEIVSKTTTTNIFGSSNTNDDQQDDFLSPIDTTDKNTPRRYVTYDELRQRNRAEHAAKFAGPKGRSDSTTNNNNNAPSNTSQQDNRKLAPLPSISKESALTPINPPPSKQRSNTRKNQYGDEVYD